MEEWRKLDYWNYEVSSFGRVRNATTKTIKLLNLGNKGYYTVALRNKRHRINALVHHLVATAFIGERPRGLMVLHGDGNRINNMMINLRYGTRLDNTQDAIRHGTSGRGANSASAKLSWHDVDIIRATKRYHRCIQDLAKQFEVCEAVIRNVRSGSLYKPEYRINRP